MPMQANRRTALAAAFSALGACAAGRTLAPGPGVADSLERVFATEAQFAADAAAMGIAPAFLRYVGPDAIMFLPEPAIVNQRLVGANWPGDLQWRPAYAIASSGGDVVVTAGPSVWRINERPDYAYYFSVWVRQTDGAYRFAIDGSASMTSDLLAGFDGAPEAVFARPGARRVADAAELEREFSAARDARAAIVPHLAPRARVLRTGRPPAIGPDAARDAVAPDQALHMLRGGAVAQSGDLAWSYGTLSWTADGAEKRGAYVRAWFSDGDAWRIGLDHMAELPA